MQAAWSVAAERSYTPTTLYKSEADQHRTQVSIFQWRFSTSYCGVATIEGLLKIIGLFYRI